MSRKSWNKGCFIKTFKKLERALIIFPFWGASENDQTIMFIYYN